MAVQHRATVCDPVHRILDFSATPALRALVKAVLDSREVQRLRRISQLGLAAHVFPGATHSRLAHSLGAAHLAAIVAAQLRDNDDPNSQAIDEYTTLLVAAGLLHDVGHGPFSHAFERALAHIAPTKIKHEAWTGAIVRGPLGQLLNEHGVDAEVLAEIFEGPCSRVPTHIKQIISSQLDVDRMDYLVRDAYFSGVPLGQVDLHYLIRSLAVIEHGPGHATLGVTRKGVKSYEAFALARHMMNRTVYYHAKVAVLEFLMEECLREVALGIRNERPAEGIPSALRTLALADATNSSAFVAKNLPAYLQLTDDQIWTALSYVEDTWDGRAQELATRLLARHLPEYFYVQHGKKKELEHVLRDDGLLGNECAVRATRSTVYEEGVEDEGVFVLSEDGSVDTVSRHSFALAAYANKPEAETLLVVLDVGKRDRILRAAEKCIVPRSNGRPSPMKSVRKPSPSGPPPAPTTPKTAQM